MNDGKVVNKTKQTLNQENDFLRQQVISLEQKLRDLNENTVISSMNDMKKKYEHLLENTVSVDEFLSVKNDYKKYLYLAKTLENINKVILNDATSLNIFLTAYTVDNAPNYSKIYKKKRITSGIDEIQQRLEIAMDIIELQEDNCTCNI